MSIENNNFFVFNLSDIPNNLDIDAEIDRAIYEIEKHLDEKTPIDAKIRIDVKNEKGYIWVSNNKIKDIWFPKNENIQKKIEIISWADCVDDDINDPKMLCFPIKVLSITKPKTKPKYLSSTPFNSNVLYKYYINNLNMYNTSNNTKILQIKGVTTKKKYPFVKTTHLNNNQLKLNIFFDEDTDDIYFAQFFLTNVVSHSDFKIIPIY